MHDALEFVYTMAVIVTLWSTAIGLGAGHGVLELRGAIRQRALFARLVLLDVLLVPLIVVGLVGILSVPADYAVGLLIVGTASAGPLGLKLSQVAHGAMPMAVALVIVLELANIAAMPIWADILLPDSVALPLAEIWRTLLVGILVPLVVGFAVHAWMPRRSAAIADLAVPISTVGLAVLVTVVVARDGSAVITALGSGVPGVAVGTIVSTLVLGWLFGGPGASTRRTGALVSSVRANAVALAVTTTVYGTATAATSAIVVFGLCSTVIVTAAAVILGRRVERQSADQVRDEAASTQAARSPG